jgi:lipid A 3-O-deacylase
MNNRRLRLARHAAPLALLLATGLSTGARGDDYSPSFSLQIENDWFAKAAGSEADRDYTTGIRLSYLTDPIAMPEWVRNLDVPTFLGSAGDNRIRRLGFSINQNLYTPENTQTKDPIPDDRPYAGWLSLGVALQTIHRQGDEPIRMDSMELSLGVVGPWALGEQLQNNFHDFIGDDESLGWDNQLRNEPALQLTFERRWRTGAWELVSPLGLETDFVPYIGAGLGNVLTYGSVGGIVRLGEDLRKDFGPPRVRPAIAGSEAFNASGISWYLFAGLEGQAVAHNIFLDGNSFRDGPSVTRNPLVAEGQAGLAIFVGDVRIAYTHVLKTPEFEERDRWQQYGSLSLGFSF